MSGTYKPRLEIKRPVKHQRPNQFNFIFFVQWQEALHACKDHASPTVTDGGKRVHVGVRKGAKSWRNELVNAQQGRNTGAPL